MKMTFECWGDVGKKQNGLRPWRYTISIGEVSAIGFCETFCDCLKACEVFLADNTVSLYEDVIRSEPVHYSS